MQASGFLHHAATTSAGSETGEEGRSAKGGVNGEGGGQGGGEEDKDVAEMMSNLAGTLVGHNSTGDA